MMENLSSLTAHKLRDLIEKGEANPRAVLDQVFERIDKLDGK